MALLLMLALALPPAAHAAFREPATDAESEKAQEELDAIQRRIDSGELPKIQFDLDSAKLREEAAPVLDLIAELLLKNPRLKLRITAHTCNLGTHEYNLHLSRARAKSVKEALVRRGVPPPSIRFYGRSYDEPIADNRTEEGRELNRRVEFQVVKREWASIY